jgi:hypothetical protein
MDCYGAVNLRLEVTVWLAADFTFPPTWLFFRRTVIFTSTLTAPAYKSLFPFALTGASLSNNALNPEQSDFGRPDRHPV